MKNIIINIVLSLSCIIFSTSATAQDITEQAAAGSIEAAMALEDPAERITALRKFLRNNIIPEQNLMAREAIVVSWAQIGEVNLNDNDIQKAVSSFQKALGEVPKTISDSFFEDTLIRIPLAVSVRGYRNEAILLGRELEKLVKGETKRLAALGEFYMTIEAPDDAIRALTDAAGSGKTEARLHRALGAAYRMGLRLDDAIAEYQEAIRIDSNDPRAYYELGNLYRALNANDDAIKLYRKQLNIDPGHSSSYKGLALAYLALGDEEKSTAALNQARDIRGTTDEVTKDLYLQTQLAFLYLLQNKLPQARKASDTALAVEPRYGWARIVAAEVDLAEGKFFDAERNLLAGKEYAGFPSLYFTFGKLYMTVEDFDGALEYFTKAFSWSRQNEFTARLGGVLNVKADNLRELLAREHRASIFIADTPTRADQFKIAEHLVRFDILLESIKSETRSKKSDQIGNTDRSQLEELDREAMGFIEAENSRKSFRSLYIAQRLSMAGVLTGTAAELADIALGLAEIAVSAEGSLHEYPNYDRQGRLAIFRGRALDAKGWALFKSGKNEEAEKILTEAVIAYGQLPESKRALWHLAIVKETLGDERTALDLYIAGYDPPTTASSTDIGRTVIELLYRKVHGSLDGLDQRIGPAIASGNAGTVSINKPEKPLLRVEPKQPEPPVPSRPPAPVTLPLLDTLLISSTHLQTGNIDPLLIENSEKIALLFGLVEEIPPPPPEIKTPEQPKTHTRKRRVTVPDNPPQHY